MVVMADASSFFLISSPQHGFCSITSSDLGCTKYASSCGMHAKAHVATRTGVMDWRMPHSSIPTTFRKPLMMLNCKKKGLELVSDLGLGSFVKDGFVFRQNFYIRSFEIGPDRKVLVENLMNYLQETSINHFKAIGLFHDGMGSTPEMNKRSLIWAMTKLHIAVDHYPTWGDVIQIDTWTVTSGTYSMRCNWMFRDSKTDKILARASSIIMMMNKKTRRISKIPDEVQAELKQIYVDTQFIFEDDTRKWSKLDENTIDHVCNGIMSVPMTIMEKYELASMTLEYRRECRKEDVLQCHTYVLGKTNDGIVDCDHVHCQHLIQLEVGSGGGGGDGDEILKGRTKWRPKYEKC
ncbi:hypothetical protein L6452_21695 [Arctium lappa]|uniref:Uncharacterized protein n=1 Tax=Arctium lappa TaxID=4217 RepID=A0ACB9AYF1_ARCLA|nr:hypothetical protein L6452_21695 [Arctium lappa]